MFQVLSDYLLPTNPIALVIVIILTCFFFSWIAGLIYCWRRLSLESKQIQKNEDINKLAVARQKRTRERGKIFNDFLSDKDLSKDSPIAKHLKAIFSAGWDESRLEVSELINHTISNLFRWNSLLRAVLAVFIVIGLLGTLFGLTDSLTDLSPVLKESTPTETTTENSERMTKALGVLMDDIKGAFAPSIWGIIFTILGVILYGIYLQFACYPVKSILEQLTLTIWVPQLYPTTPQTLVQTLQRSESQMQKGFETAAEFNESVEKVHDNIDKFNENLAQASTITQPLSNSVTQISKAAVNISTATDRLNTGLGETLDKFSQEFKSSVSHLTGFQKEIRKLHEQFQEKANEKLNQFQEAANQKLDQQIETLNKQDENLTTTVEVLKNSEKLYIDSCRQLDNTLQGFLNKTTETSTNIETANRKFLEGINTTNREWIKEIQEQLKTDLAIIQPTLENVQVSLDGGLKGLTNQFKFFQTPIEKTADQIEAIIENFTKIMENTVDNLESEFEKQHKKIKEQNEKYHEAIKEQNEKYGEQLTEVKSLNESVINLLNQLHESSNNQKSAVGNLSSNIGSLKTDLRNLEDAINSFTSNSGALNESIATIEGHTQTLGTASQQFAEKVEKADVTPLTVGIGKLNTSINEISQSSRTLTDAVNTVNTLLRQMSSSNSKPKPRRSFWDWLFRR